jgi:hypothetical protein
MRTTVSGTSEGTHGKITPTGEAGLSAPPIRPISPARCPVPPYVGAHVPDVQLIAITTGRMDETLSTETNGSLTLIVPVPPFAVMWTGPPLATLSALAQLQMAIAYALSCCPVP